jgi:hypothetical protein
MLMREEEGEGSKTLPIVSDMNEEEEDEDTLIQEL